jgi:hypothetical protein
MTTNEFCSLQQCRNMGCNSPDRNGDLCTRVKPPAKPSTVRRGIDCKVQTPRWNVKGCRAKKCSHLGKEEMMSGERCMVLGKHASIMPGNLTHCIQDAGLPPDELLRHMRLPPIAGKEEAGEDAPYSWDPRKNPGIKNCPGACPYKLIEEVDGSGKRKIKKGTCAFCGGVLGGSVGACHTTILDAAPEHQPNQIAIITVAIERLQKHPPSAESCEGMCCPDGVMRCGVGDEACPLIKVPFADLKECPNGCPDRKIIPREHGKAQGYCGITGQKLREMQKCPNDEKERETS